MGMDSTHSSTHCSKGNGAGNGIAMRSSVLIFIYQNRQTAEPLITGNMKGLRNGALTTNLAMASSSSSHVWKFPSDINTKHAITNIVKTSFQAMFGTLQS